MVHSPKKHIFEVDELHHGLRLDKFLSLQIHTYSRTFFQKMIRKQSVRVNGQEVKSSHIIESGDNIELLIPPPEQTEMTPEKIDLDIIYEDEHLLVINKAAGMVVHPGAGIRNNTLVNALLYYCQNLSSVGGRIRPGIVHRLDKNTSGLLVVAKNDHSHINLQQQFSQKLAAREYKALVWGSFAEKEGILNTLINRSKSDRKKFSVSPQGKEAVTIYKVEEEFEFLSLVKVRLETGRTHQIRVHFNYIHHPIFGDPDYSGRKSQLNRLSSLSQKNFAVYLLKGIQRQALHAYKLGFIHPVQKKKMEFTVPLPNDFSNILEKTRRNERIL